jgi:hypothetical protein
MPIRLRELAEANKTEDQEILSNTPTKMTTDIKNNVFKGKVLVEPEE